MASEPTLRLFTVDEYYRMGEAGILREDDRVELLDGEIVQLSPIGSRHAAAVTMLHQRLSGAVGKGGSVRVQNPLRLSHRSEPVPDICVVRRRHDYYAGAHPEPEDVLLVVEVADTSLAYDRNRKIPSYARAGVPEVWLVELPGAVVRAFRSPAADGYRSIAEYAAEDELAIEALPGVRMPVREIVP